MNRQVLFAKLHFSHSEMFFQCVFLHITIQNDKKHLIINIKQTNKFAIFANTKRNPYLCSTLKSYSMEIAFAEDYLRELYYEGKAHNKKYRFQPQIIKKYVRVIDLAQQHRRLLSLQGFTLRSISWRQERQRVCKSQ